MHIFED
jgi:hypothetical protein